MFKKVMETCNRVQWSASKYCGEKFLPNDWSMVWKSNNNIKVNHFPIEVEYTVDQSKR